MTKVKINEGSPLNIKKKEEKEEEVVPTANITINKAEKKQDKDEEEEGGVSDKKSEEPETKKETIEVDLSEKKKDEEEEGDEEVEEIDDSSSEEDDPEDEEFNSYLIAAKQWQKDGFLPEDLELDKDLDASTLKDLYYKHHQESVTKQLYPKVYASIVDELGKIGVNEDNIKIAQALDAGTPPELIYEGSKYKRYAETDLKGLSHEEKERKMVDIVTEYLKTRDWRDDEIEDRIESLIAEDKLKKEFDEAKGSFAKKSEDFNKQIEKQNEERLQAIRKQQEHDAKVWADIINSKQIRGERFTESRLKDFQEAVATPTKTVEIGGKVQKITEFQEFQYSLLNDLETQLYLFKLARYRGEEKDIEKSIARQEAEEEILSKLSNRKEVVKKAYHKNNKKGAKKENQIVLDFS